MAHPQERTISFHRLLISTPSGYKAVGAVDWKELLNRWSARSFGDQGIEGTYFLPYLDHPLPALGIHREVEDSFQSLLDKQNATAVDLLDNVGSAGGPVLANSTAIAFLPDKAIIACALGNTSSPRPTSLAPFLDAVSPPGPRDHWVVEPLYDRGAVERFRTEANGIYKAEVRMSTMKDLLTVEQSAGGMSAALDAVAREIGSEVDVDITITLKEHGRQSRTAQNGFKRFIESSDLSRVIGARKARVHAVSQDGSDIGIIDLVEHKFTLKASVQTETLASKTFTALLNTTACTAMNAEDSVYELVQ